MSRRKGELTAGRIDREWPHQVALQADPVAGENYIVARDFCRDLSLCPRGHSVQRDRREYRVFCFSDPAHADRFFERFNGERFDPKYRGRGGSRLIAGLVGIEGGLAS
jgi:hypothetical protein